MADDSRLPDSPDLHRFPALGRLASRGRRVPYVQQLEAADCGAASLAMVLGFHGHAAGPTIGMWDNQGPTPVRGDWILYPNTCYAIEGNVTVPIPEWDDQLVHIKLEQDGWFDGEEVIYIGGRQTRWHVIR